MSASYVSDLQSLGARTANEQAQVTSGLVPDGRHFVSRARDEASSWRNMYKAPIPVSTLANRMGAYVQVYTMHSSVRPFGVTAIVGGWDSEAELEVDGQVGNGPGTGAGGKKEGSKRGGPFLYMIEPSGSYWVRMNPVPIRNL
jgi:20S proteasome subunit alpha 7